MSPSSSYDIRAEHYRDIAENSCGIECWHDPAGTLQWVNAPFGSLASFVSENHGASHEFPFSALHGDDRDEMENSFRLSLERRMEARDLSCRLVRKDGAFLWAAISWRPMYGVDGAYLGLRTSIRDITLQKAAEKDLRESEELHRITLSTISDAVFITDEEGAFTYVCPNVHIIFGYFLDEVRAMGTIPQLLGDRLFDSADLAEAGELVNIERDITDKNGVLHSLLVNIKKVSIKGGTILYTCRDVTERKRREEEKRRIDEQYHKLFEGSLDAVCITGEKGGIIDCNPAFESLTGYTRKELFRTNILALYHNARDRKKLRDHMERSGFVRDFEVEMIRRDGTSIHCLINSTRRASGGVVEFQSIIRDITGRKKTDRLLLATQAELSEKARGLEEANTALKVLLKHQEDERAAFEDSAAANFRELVRPYLLKLSQAQSRTAMNALADIIVTNMEKITRPLTKRLEDHLAVLTATERRIADMIRSGSTASGISETLGIAENTVKTHKRNIRKKLGITNRKVNLREFLSSLEHPANND